VDGLAVRREQKQERMGLLSLHSPAGRMARFVPSTADEVVDAVDLLCQDGLDPWCLPVWSKNQATRE
jgi:hypothetical protein